jgi:hypothetical protein
MRARQIVFLVTALVVSGCAENRDASTEEVQLSLDSGSAKVGNLAGDAAYGVAASAAAPRSGRPGMAPASPPAPPSAEPMPRSSEQLPTQSIAPNMVIRVGDARIKVESVDTAIVRLQDLARRVGGYVANSTSQGGERELRQATLQLKIPASRFSEAQEGLNALGKVEYMNVSTEDVGEEFVDVTARVDNARRLEQRLITLLATRTGRLDDVLSVERELARVRETIERYEGRLRYLRTRVDVSTLSVTVHESEPVVGRLGTSNRIVEAFKNAWRNFVGFIAALIESLGVLLPLAVIVFFIARAFWRNRPRRGPTTPPPPPAAE